MNEKELLQQRLNNHQIASFSFNDPAGLVAWLGAVQAQDYATAKWALAPRLQECSGILIENAFQKGRS